MAVGDVTVKILKGYAPFNLGTTVYSTDTESVFDTQVDELLANNIYYLRLDIEDYQNTTKVDRSKAAAIRAIAKGAKILWGLSSNKFNNATYEITAANWEDYRTAIKAGATWAQANGIYDFQIGNEEEYHIDGTTLTEAQLIINLKALGTEVKAIFTNGRVGYTTSVSKSSAWVAAGKGDLDFIAFNGTNATFYANIVGKFGVDESFISEFNLNGMTPLNIFMPNEEDQLNGISKLMNTITDYGFKRGLYYCYYGDHWGAKKYDGTYRKFWDLLKTFNGVESFFNIHRKTSNDHWLLTKGKDNQVYTVHIEEAP